VRFVPFAAAPYHVPEAGGTLESFARGKIRSRFYADLVEKLVNRMRGLR
jgi:hypothetical protein